jgi:AraC-type DNA-binding domain-containing proteins
MKDLFLFAHNKDILPAKFDFHLHDRYEIYFFVSGKVNYFVEKNIYSLREGDLLVMNSREIHKPTLTDCSPYERYTIHFSPAAVSDFNSSTFNLLECFENRKSGEKNKIELNSNQRSELVELLTKMERINANKTDCFNVLFLCYLTEILVLLNTAFSSDVPHKHNVSVPDRLSPILDYIDQNLDGDLSLDALESKFYMNKFYLCRLFKSFVRSSIHEYILYKRVSRAKVLLTEGVTATEACSRSGFGDYSNFIRTFKKTVGITPGQFAKSQIHGSSKNN